MTRRTIIIDPGHGGGTGCRWPGGIEDAYALAVADELLLMLSCESLHDLAEFVPTRTGNVQIKLGERGSLARAHGAAFVLSIHVNASPDPADHGTQLYHLRAHPLAGQVARAAARYAPAALAPQGARVIDATDDPRTTDDDWLHRAGNVLDAYSPVPCVLLESGYSTYPSDLAALTGPLGPSRIATFARAVVLEALAALG